MSALLNEAIEDEIRRIARSVYEEMLRHSSTPAEAGGDDDPLTAAEAALELGVSQWRVYEMIKQRKLPAYRPSPRTLRIRRGDLRAFKSPPPA